MGGLQTPHGLLPPKLMVLNAGVDLIAGTNTRWDLALDNLVSTVRLGTSSVAPSPEQTGLQGRLVATIEVRPGFGGRFVSSGFAVYRSVFYVEYTSPGSNIIGEYAAYSSTGEAVVREAIGPYVLQLMDKIRLFLTIDLKINLSNFFQNPASAVQNGYLLPQSMWPTTRGRTGYWAQTLLGFVSYISNSGNSMANLYTIGPSPEDSMLKIICTYAPVVKPTSALFVREVPAIWGPYTNGSKVRVLSISFPSNMPVAQNMLYIASSSLTSVPVSSSSSFALATMAGIGLYFTDPAIRADLSNKTLKLLFRFDQQ